jgi:hypothetical protein
MTVYYNLVDEDGNVVEGPISYPDVKRKTGLKDQVGLDELGWKEHFPPLIAPVWTEEQIATFIRSTRDAILAHCDWTQTADSPLSDAKKAEWATYRQKLRDMPADNDDVETEGFEPDDITFPTEPS